MLIEEFADHHRLKVKKDECGDPVIFGRQGRSHIYEGFDDKLGLCFITDQERVRIWNSARMKCLAVGMKPAQNGDAEGCLTFDPTDRAQVKVALQVIKARQKRVLTPEQVAVLADRLAKGRISAQPNATIS